MTGRATPTSSLEVSPLLERACHITGTTLKWGPTTARLTRALTLDPDEPETAVAICLLREAQGAYVRLDWQAAGPRIPLQLVGHLPPPSRAPDADPALLDRWVDAYTPGTLYMRVGPGFVHVRDTRPGKGARYTLDGPYAVLAVDLLWPKPRSSIPEPSQATLDELVEEGLVALLGGNCVTLPPRIRRWPIPYVAI